VEVVAWIGLVTSWLALLLILKLVFMTLRVLKQIRRLAEMTRDAARNLAGNVADTSAFAQLELLSAALTGAVRRLPVAAEDEGPLMSSVSPGLRPRPP
jgi:HAMP domain-containing protein